MARAVMRLYDGIQLAFGPTVENGYYYDFQTKLPLSEDDFPAIETEMAKIVKEDEPFERIEMDRGEAVQFCQDLGQSLKVEHLQTGLADHGRVSFYRQGEFVDLCRGPHVPAAGAIGAFKLLSVAGAYWKGDSNRQQLQRLYGTAWFKKEDMDEYLKKIDEAKRRDHRVLGKQLELFTIDPMVGSGLILWLPKGAIVRRPVGELPLRQAPGDRLPAGLHAAHRPHRALPDLWALSVLRRQPVPAALFPSAGRSHSRAFAAMDQGRDRRRRPGRPIGAVHALFDPCPHPSACSQLRRAADSERKSRGD